MSALHDSAFGAVLCILTLCFVADPPAVLRESHRVLPVDGRLVLGVVPAEGPLGQHYRELGSSGHACYRHASFFMRPELNALLAGAGFRILRRRSALVGYVEPDAPVGANVEDDDPAAGFLAVLAGPRA